MKTEEQRLLDELYDREKRDSIQITGDVEVNGQKLPDPKKHQIISFIKSGIRIVACFLGILGFYELGFFGLLAAEIVGIYEELV